MAAKRTLARMARLLARWRESGESRSSFGPPETSCEHAMTNTIASN